MELRDILSQAMGKGKAAAAALQGYPSVFRRIKEDHGAVSAMMQMVASSDEDSDIRSQLYPRIRQELLAHAEAEEQHFYPELERYDQTRDLIPHAREEHQDMKALIEDLATSDPNTSRWTERFKSLKDAVETHVKEEENDVFPRAKDVISDEKGDEMERKFLETKQQTIDQLSRGA